MHRRFRATVLLPSSQQKRPIYIAITTNRARQGATSDRRRPLCHLIVRLSARPYLMQTDRTCFKSVIPIMIFSMPSILRVRIPLSRVLANNSATRARS